MKKVFFIALSALFFNSFPIQAQAGSQNGIGEDEETLFTVGGEPVSKEEFEYVYRKNNPAKQNDYSKASLEEYLDLYINFKLKVKEARTLQIDTIDAVQQELERYRQQLVKSYFDKEVSDQLLANAYDRMREEIQVYHIMMSAAPNASPDDTMSTLNRMKEVRQGLVAGYDWDETAKDVSHDSNTKNDGGYLGYMTSLQIPDEKFEDVIYSTKKGEISPVFRTQYGYHIVKTGARRPASGTVQVAHLLIKTPNNPNKEQVEAAQSKAKMIYDQIMAGASFDSLARAMSDDKGTAPKAGVLPAFGTGKMLPEFETAAFALKEAGDISKPVKTAYGFHIIKLIDKTPLASFDDMKADLTRKLQRSGRTDKARTEYIASSKLKYNFVQYAPALQKFKAGIDSAILINTWRARKAVNKNEVLFRLNDREYTVKDFAEHVQRGQRAFRERSINEKVDRLYDQFVEEMVIEYALGKKYEDFRRLLKEYRDGILLFELTEEKVWQKAMQDTTGLDAFYDGHKGDYMWGERTDATVYTISDQVIAKKIRKSLKKGMDPEAIKNKYNKAGLDVVSVKEGVFAEGQQPLVDKVGKKVGLSEDFLNDDGTVAIVNINKIVAPTSKTLAEAKGYVISDYQEYLEKLWVKELRAKYPVDVNKQVFNNMIK